MLLLLLPLVQCLDFGSLYGTVTDHFINAKDKVVDFKNTLLPPRKPEYKTVGLDYGQWKGIMSEELNGIEGKLKREGFLFDKQIHQIVSFFNIPFAAPPIASLRFMPPQKPGNLLHLGVLDATKPGPSCMVDTTNVLNEDAFPSEDCLQLNVFVPAHAKPNDNLPVLVYIYPGSFKDGYGNFIIYRKGAQKMASLYNVTVVTLNYRMGAFGYLPAEELKSCGGLNLGLQDIAAAFKWVRQYIHAFGGNPHQVTSFGLSAGGLSTATLLVAGDGKLDLFDRAFMMSGNAIPILETTTTARPVVEELFRLTNCTGPHPIACLRLVSAKDLLSASQTTNTEFHSPLSTIYGPIIDDTLLKRQVFASLDQGLFRKIPIMINVVQDEAMSFVKKQVKLESDVPGYLKRLFPFMTNDEMAQLHSLYPKDTSGINFHNVSDTFTDAFFKCPARKLAKTYNAQHLPVIKTVNKHAINVLSLFRKERIGVVHGTDIPLWWSYDRILTGKEEEDLSKLMMRATVDFASCSDSKACSVGEASHPWLLYSASPYGVRTELRTPTSAISSVTDNGLDVKCAFFEKVFTKNGRITGLSPITREQLQKNLFNAKAVSRSGSGSWINGIKDRIKGDITDTIL